MHVRLLLVLALVSLSSITASAQTDGTIVGTATDETKGVLPGVVVTAVDLATARQFTAATDVNGEYRIVAMPPGRYKLQAELEGFATIVLPEIEILVGQSRRVPFEMQVATLAETLTITGEAPLVDTRTVQVGGNIDRRQMEELPIQGRNWMELGMMVKGVTANDFSTNRPGVLADGMFRLNLDGQEMTQAVAGTSAFRQPGLSKESIAEFQVVTNMFDITQGRSSQIQIQAISRAGTNNFDGTMYGYFRSDRFNAADPIANRVLPYSNQQVGGSIGGPVLRDKIHFFTTYEYEREPNTIVSSPPAWGGQSISLPTKTTQNNFMARVDWQVSAKDHLMVRGTHWDIGNPFEAVTGTEHPTQASDRIYDSFTVNGVWSRVLSPSAVQEVKVSYFDYHWLHIPSADVPLTPAYFFPIGRIAARWNYPEEFFQDTPAVRYDLSVHKGSHDFKIGGEFLKWKDSGYWEHNQRGFFLFGATPADIARRFPLDAWNDASRWDLSGLDSLVIRYDINFPFYSARVQCPSPPELPSGNCRWGLDFDDSGSNLEIPRPTWGVWFGDTWAVNSRLTLNMGVRYDLDWGATAPPGVRETSVPVNNGLFTEDVGFKNGIRDYNNVAPRVGFSWNVLGTGAFVIRGGSGIYYGLPTSELAFDHQMFNGQRILVNSYVNDGQPGFIADPTRGLTAADYFSGRVPLPPQAPWVIAHEYEMPYTFQNIIGFQRQLGERSAFDADLTYWHAYDMGHERDANLFYDPATGFNKNPIVFGRPRSDFTEIKLRESVGEADYLALATQFTRRYANNFQGNVTYTLMFFKHDNGAGTSGFGGSRFNQFNVDEEWGRSVDFQRHTLRLNGIVRAPWGINLAGIYFFGSGNYYPRFWAANPFGISNFNVALNRLRPNENGVFDPLRSDLIIERNSLKGRPIHKVDLRVMKEVPIGPMKVAGIFEVFNLLNHENYGNYNGQENSTTFGSPRQLLNVAYLPRAMQLAFKITF